MLSVIRALKLVGGSIKDLVSTKQTEQITKENEHSNSATHIAGASKLSTASSKLSYSATELLKLSKSGSVCLLLCSVCYH